MRRWIAAGAVLLAHAGLAGAAGADTYLRVQNGDVVTTSIESAGEVDIFHLIAPQDAALRVEVRVPAKGPELTARIHDGGMLPVTEAGEGRSILLVASLPEHGQYRIVVAARDGSATGDYTLAVSWTTPQPAPATVFLLGSQSGGQRTTFAGWRGDTATITVRPARGSRAKPRLETLTGPGYTTHTSLGGGRRAVVQLPDTFGYEVTVANRVDAQGDVVVSVALRNARRRLRLTGRIVPTDAHLLVAGESDQRRATRIVGDSVFTEVTPNSAGGLLSLTGCEVSVPARSVRSAGSVVMAAAPDLTPSAPGLIGSGHAMFVGPADLRVRDGAALSVLLKMYDRPPAGTSPRLFARDAGGTVTEIPESEFEYSAYDGTVTFQASAPATFQAFRPLSPYIGVAVAADDDRIAVGSPGEAVGVHPNAGVVRVYARDGATWAEEAALQLADPQDGDLFGQALAMSGGTLVVGALERGDTGAAFVYVRNGEGEWVAQAALLPDTSSVVFGACLALDEDTIVVGAGHEGPGSVAYVFERAGGQWSETQRLTVPGFGSPRVAVSGDTLLAAPPGLGLVGQPGDARVYVRDGAGWSVQADLVSSDGYLPGEATDGAGDLNAVALEGDVAVFTSTQDAVGLGGAGGVAWVFVRTGGVWTERAALHPSDTHSQSMHFGESVAIRNGRILVGAPFYREGSVYRGAGYLFGGVEDGFPRLAMLGDIGGTANRDLGRSVALTASGGTAILGSGFPVVSTAAVGQAYVVDVE